mmetsp:Transcript_4111/g.5211  ORF Transcript_4111/g.5211 Transcript_4111/m.5211 type:complete len:103 (+) Transcript_4111:169-477(+)
MRGANIVCAFGQEQFVADRQLGLVDKRTIFNTIAHGCRTWFNLRIQLVALLFYVFSLFLIATKRLSVDSISLVLLLKWSSEIDFLGALVLHYTWFTRNAQQT